MSFYLFTFKLEKLSQDYFGSLDKSLCTWLQVVFIRAELEKVVHAFKISDSASHAHGNGHCFSIKTDK